MTARQDLDASRTATPATEAPEEAFLRMLNDEEKEREPTAPVSQPESQPEPDPSTNLDETKETEEEVPEAPDEVDSEDLPTEDSEDPSETDEADEPTEALYRVMANGEEKHVTLEELTRSYSRESDYTRQKQELAEQERSFTADAELVRAERAKYDGMLGQLEAAVQQSLPQEPDWAKLRAENPVDFTAKYAEWQQLQGNLQKIQAERQRVFDAENADRAKQQEAIVRTEQDKLLKDFPDLGDSEKGPQMQAAMMETATSVGFSADEVNAVVDSRTIKLLHYATLYLNLKKSQPTRTKRPKVTKTVRPGSRTRAPTRSKTREAEKRLRSSGSMEDATAVFLEDLNSAKR